MAVSHICGVFKRVVGTLNGIKFLILLVCFIILVFLNVVINNRINFDLIHIVTYVDVIYGCIVGFFFFERS